MVQQRAAHGNRHYWVSMNAFPYEAAFNQVLSVDWRTDPNILMYSKLANSIMDAHGIPTLDTHAISHPLLDLTYDIAHYVGVVGLAQARLALSVILNDACRGGRAHSQQE